MSGYFKLVDAHDHGYRLKMMSGDGELVAVSAYFPTKQAAVEGIDAIREIAGTGPVMDGTRKERATPVVQKTGSTKTAAQKTKLTA